MLKDSWKDKINGESIVDAEDINEIAHSIINLEKSGGASIELAQDVNGDSTEKAVAQKAVKDALAGKVDKIDDNWKAYTTDANGNTVAKPLAAKPSAGGVVLYNEGGILKTNAPVEDDDAANKGFVEDGFLKQSTETWKLYGTGKMNEATGKAVLRMVQATAIGTSDGYVANFRPVAAKDFDYDPSIFKCTLGVCDPQKPMQVTNKRYVDNAIDKATANIREAAVGTLYTTQQVHNMNEKAPIPTGALPYAYLEHVDEWCMVGSRDGDGIPTMVGQAKVMEIRQVNDTTSELATMPPTIGQYFKLEDGATHLYLVLGDVEFFDPNNIYYNEFFVTTSVLYQVKVGG